jgi:hypothetical protein
MQHHKQQLGKQGKTLMTSEHMEVQEEVNASNGSCPLVAHSQTPMVLVGGPLEGRAMHYTQ